MKSNFLFQMIEVLKSLFVSTGMSWALSNEGCHVTFSDGARTVCSCSHLSTFAVLMASVNLEGTCVNTHDAGKPALLQGGAGVEGRDLSKRRWKNMSRGTAMYLPLLPFFLFIFLNSRIMLYNALVSAVQQHEYVHIPFPFESPLTNSSHPVRSSQNTKLNSLCYWASSS